MEPFLFSIFTLHKNKISLKIVHVVSMETNLIPILTEEFNLTIGLLSRGDRIRKNFWVR